MKGEELIERVRAATAGDRDIDVALWDMVEGWPVVGGLPECRMTPAGTAAAATVYAPPYTSSVDAILALIERELPGQWWMLLGEATHEMWTLQRLPLALCLAFLEARNSTEAK